MGLLPGLAKAQETADELIEQAMQAYSNLDLDTAKSSLEKAKSVAPDKSTMARIYANYGVLWAGGLMDNARGQEHFLAALCLDSSTEIDPYVSTPEIQTLFNMAQQQVSDTACRAVEAKIPPVPDGAIPLCGRHGILSEQKQQHELPIYVKMDDRFFGQVTQMLARYAFNDEFSYTDLPLYEIGTGFGGIISCELGIRQENPSAISYYIEGYDQDGQLVCRHGNQQLPMRVAMSSESMPVSPIAGLEPKGCGRCLPGDPECPWEKVPDKIGDDCRPDVGCAEGLVCGGFGTCEEPPDDTGPKDPSKGPSTFYVNLGGGSGFGFISQDLTITKWDAKERKLTDVVTKPSGSAWAGVPVRVGIGVFAIPSVPNLSIEVTGRFDVKVDSYKEPMNCWDAVQDDPNANDVLKAKCNGPIERVKDQVDDGQLEPDDPKVEQAAKESIVFDDNDEQMFTTTPYFAWLVNVRLRYWFLHFGSTGLSAFLGGGYGHIKYRVQGQTSPYFPMVGKIDIEVGPALSYNFSKNVAFFAEVPIDIMVGDGWAVNVDLNLGFTFGT
jgi:hypothetical protein